MGNEQNSWEKSPVVAIIFWRRSRFLSYLTKSFNTKALQECIILGRDNVVKLWQNIEFLTRHTRSNPRLFDVLATFSTGNTVATWILSKVIGLINYKLNTLYLNIYRTTSRYIRQKKKKMLIIKHIGHTLSYSTIWLFLLAFNEWLFTDRMLCKQSTLLRKNSCYHRPMLVMLI